MDEKADIKQKLIEGAVFVALTSGLIALFVLLVGRINNSGDIVENNDDLLLQQERAEKAILPEFYSFYSPQVIVDPYNNSPLSAVVAFRSNSAITPSIRVVGRNGAQDLEFNYPTGESHILEIYGLYEGANEVYLSSELGEQKLEVYASPITYDYHCENAWAIETKTDWSRAYMCDEAGNIRWMTTRNSHGEIIMLDDGRLLGSTERKLTDNESATGLYVFDFVGKIYDEINVPGGYFEGLAQMPNGNYLLGGSDVNKPATHHDYILEIKPDGAIEREYKLDDVLPKKITNVTNFDPDDWFRISGLAYDQANDAVIASGTNARTIISIDKNSKINWLLGAYSSYLDLGLKNDEGGYRNFKKVKLLDYSDNLRVSETNDEGEVSYTRININTEKHTYNAEYPGFINKKKIFFPSLTLKIVAATKHSTPSYTQAKNETRSLNGASAIDDEYLSKNLQITQERDRLSVRGSYKVSGLSKYDKADSVSIILSQNYTNYIYEIDSSNEYNYLSIDGLSGQYNIYVELNGKTYDIKQRVEF